MDSHLLKKIVLFFICCLIQYFFEQALPITHFGHPLFKSCLKAWIQVRLIWGLGLFITLLQAKKGKKTGKKATLAGSAKAGRKEDLDAFGAGNYDYEDEFDDFM